MINLAYTTKKTPEKQTRTSGRMSTSAFATKNVKTQLKFIEDPLTLSGPFKCEVCGEILSSAANVYKHIASCHPDVSLSSLTIRHVSSDHVYLTSALFRYVVTCGLKGCFEFAGSNDSIHEALSKLKEHWPLKHSELDMNKFCYQDISVEHDNVEEKPVKEVIESKRREDKSEELVVLEKPVFAEVFQGPFSCLVSGCGKIIQTEKEVSLHCNKLHLNTPVSELIFSDGSGKTLGLAHFYRNVLQCSICKTLR